MEKEQSIFHKLFGAGIVRTLDAEHRRKIFLSNVLSISMAFMGIIIMVNDYFLAHNFLAGHRRLIVVLCLLSVPLLNQKHRHTIAKVILVLTPGLVIYLVPVLVKDFFPGQLLWFHYGTAILSAIPILVFHHKDEKYYAIFLYTFYLLLTIFIDDILFYFNPVEYEFSYLLQNFTDYKIPPIFISITFALVIYWFNSINVRYSSKLSSINADLLQSNEELLTKTEQLDQVNKNLEQLVIERSAMIATKEKQIIEYANLNAHKVRGPLARILGLIHLTEQTDSQAEIKQLIEKMDYSASELNEIIKEMNQILSEAD